MPKCNICGGIRSVLPSPLKRKLEALEKKMLRVEEKRNANRKAKLLSDDKKAQ